MRERHTQKGRGNKEEFGVSHSPSIAQMPLRDEAGKPLMPPTPRKTETEDSKQVKGHSGDVEA